MKRFAVVAAAGAIVVAAVVVGLGSIAQASTGPGALDCPTLGVYNPTHYGLQVGATVTCTIDNSGEADGAVDIVIRSSDFGNTMLTGTASGGTITFTYTAPANGCNTGIVAYGASGTLADNSVISGGTAAAGFAFLGANGVLVACVTAPPTPSSSPSPNPSPSLSVLSTNCGSVTIANLPTGYDVAFTPGTVVETANGTFPLAAGSYTWIEHDATGAELGSGSLDVGMCPTSSPSPSGSPTPGASPSTSPSPTGGVGAASASPTGGVLAATGDNTPAQGLALLLVACGLFAVVGGGLAWRRRRV